MRIFVLGAGATGSLLAQLLERQGHTVWCGDRDLQRAHHFLGKSSSIAITDVNARNLHGIVRAARGCQLIVNASASVFNQIVMRAALRLRAHYLDLSSHLTRNPFKAAQLPDSPTSWSSAPPKRCTKWSPCTSASTKALKATTPSRNGPRKLPSTKPFPARACIATADSAWASVLRSWKNSASRTRSAPRM